MTEQKHNRRVAVAWSKGYKAGYVHRSDEEYDKALFDMWKEHVSGPTEKHTGFHPRSEMDLQLAEEF